MIVSPFYETEFKRKIEMFVGNCGNSDDSPQNVKEKHDGRNAYLSRFIDSYHHSMEICWYIKKPGTECAFLTGIKHFSKEFYCKISKLGCQ